MTSSAGQSIYSAFEPTIKMMVCIAAGVFLAKTGKLPPAGARGVSILSLNVGLPCLIFSSMITSFGPANISAFGSLALMAFLYEVVGCICAWVVRETLYVPTDFRWGILVMGFLSNWGNMPLATVLTVGQNPPFDGTADIQLGIAYGSVFILIMNIFLFGCGFHKLCALDFKEANMSRPQSPLLKDRIKGWSASLRGHLRSRRAGGRADEEKDHDLSPDVAVGDLPNGEGPASPADIYPKGLATENIHGEEHGDEPSELKQRNVRYAGGTIPTRKASRASSFTSMLESTRPIPSTAPLDATDLMIPCQATTSRTSRSLLPPNSNEKTSALPSATPSPAPLLPVCSNHGEGYNYHDPNPPEVTKRKKTILKRGWSIIRGFFMPITCAIIIALPCSLILELKALFTHVDGYSGTKVPNAPNGGAPLAFVLDTTSFLGQVSVPMSLILLGAAFARLKFPKNWRELPIASVIAMTCVKMIIVPMFGIFVVQAMRDDTGLFPKTDKMRTFVGIITAGTPAAVNQLVVTQLYNPEGTAHSLATFLLLQYAVMPIFSTILSALALYIVER